MSSITAGVFRPEICCMFTGSNSRQVPVMVYRFPIDQILRMMYLHPRELLEYGCSNMIIVSRSQDAQVGIKTRQAGLIDIIVPVTIGQKTVAYLLTSQAAYSNANRDDAANVLMSLGMSHAQAMCIVSKFSSMNLYDASRIESTMAATVAVLVKLLQEYQSHKQDMAA